MGETLEAKYKRQLTELGIYMPAFDSTIHQLAVLEREQSRVREEWKAPMDAWRDIKTARRKAKEAEKIAEEAKTVSAATAWKETAEAWTAAAEIWKEAAEEWEDHPMTDKLYETILKQDRLILSLRETLGLTPKSLKRFRSGFGEGQEEPEEKPKTTLELLIEKRRASG